MKARGPLLLLCTAALWGLAFVAQTSAAEHVDPFTFNATRNAIGTLFLSGVIAWRARTGQDRPPREAARRASLASAGVKRDVGSESPGAAESGYSRRTLLIGGFACGLLLFGASWLQQAGITAYPPEAAASSRSAFVTATYMVMVALVGVFAGKKPHPIVLGAVVLALAGMYLLCVPNGLGSVYLGDWLVFASALGWALHILAIDRYTQVDGVRLSRIQLIVSGTLSLVCALAFEHPDPAAIVAAAVPILYAGIASDGIAYTLQIIAQQTTDPTVTSIILSLESVFAALGGWLILSERLSPTELLGCAMVFAAALIAQLPHGTTAQTREA